MRSRSTYFTPGLPLDRLEHHEETHRRGEGSRFALLDDAAANDAGAFVTTRYYDGVDAAAAAGAEPHSHSAVQLFLVLGAPGALLIEAAVGDLREELRSPASIYVPAGVRHQVTVQEGTGSLVSILFQDHYA